MRRLSEHSGVPGHFYPLALLCHDIMPPPPQVFSTPLSVASYDIIFLWHCTIFFSQVEKDIGEKRVISFHGVGLSVASEIKFQEIAGSYENPNEVSSLAMLAFHTLVIDILYESSFGTPIHWFEHKDHAGYNSLESNQYIG